MKRNECHIFYNFSSFIRAKSFFILQKLFKYLDKDVTLVTNTKNEKISQFFISQSIGACPNSFKASLHFEKQHEPIKASAVLYADKGDG